MLVFDQDINLRNKIHCTYLIGLGHLGLGEETKGHQFCRKYCSWIRITRGPLSICRCLLYYEGIKTGYSMLNIPVPCMISSTAERYTGSR